MKKIVFVEHHDNPRDDRATSFVRELGFEIDLVMPVNDEPLPEVDDDTAGVVVCGGAMNVTEMEQLPYLRTEAQWIEQCIKTDIPMFGICLGSQLLAHVLGAKIGYHPDKVCEFGYYQIDPTDAGSEWFPKPMLGTQAHFQTFELPDGATLLATGETFENQAFQYGQNIFGVQFHPEIDENCFRRWQNAEWAFYGSPGAQSREEQDQLMAVAEPYQGQWFRQFLETFFVRQ